MVILLIIKYNNYYRSIYLLLQKGQFLRRKFIFENNILISKSIGKEIYPAKNKIEKIILFGISNSPKNIILEYEEKQIELLFNYQNEKLIIKKPDVLITKDWKIILFY